MNTLKSARAAWMLFSGMVGVLLANPGVAEPLRTLQAAEITPQLPVGTSLQSPATPQTASKIAQVSAPEQDSTLQVQASEASSQPNAALTQVTSVSQLSDVRPTDWAFQALQSLVERYGCIAGYPDRTYRGNRALTRYEFAAGLNACLDRVNELVAAATADLVRKEDLATLQKLQEEFAAELATLRGRVDALEARTATLEKQQFSTTTKLTGEAIFEVSDFFGDQVRDFGNNAVFQNRVRLELQSSFSGRDLLRTRLAAGNFTPPVVPGSLLPVVPEGTAEGRLSASVQGNNNNQIEIDRLDYTFPIGERLKFYVAAVGGRSSYFVPSTVNPLFDDRDGGQGAISAFGQQNPIYRIGGGAGFAASFALDRNEKIVLTGGYLAENAANPANDNGLFNGNDAVVGQLTLTPSPSVQIGLTYVRGFHFAGNSIFDLGAGDEFFTGTVPANALHTGLGVDAFTNSYGAEVAWRVSPKLVINAFGGYTDLSLDNGRFHGEIWYYGLGLAFPDLLKKGSLGGIIVGVEPYLGGVDRNGLNLNALGLTNDTSVHVEAFYRYQVNDRISITPGLIWITAPDQFRGNDGYVIGTLRTTFSF